MKHKAFTLIELLVVIAIIAILAAILFPVFAQAKLAAKKAMGISNHKQLATASVLYNGDYDDRFVMLENSAARFTIANMLQPYIKNPTKNVNALGGNLFPDDGVWVSPAENVTPASNLYFTVSYNYLYLTNVDSSTGFVPVWTDPSRWGIWAWTQGGRSATEVNDPANTVMFSESGRSDGPRGANPTWSGLLTPNARLLNGPNAWMSIPQGRYARSCPVAWVDGHVTAKDVSSFSHTFSPTGAFVPSQTPPDRFFDLE